MTTPISNANSCRGLHLRVCKYRNGIGTVCGPVLLPLQLTRSNIRKADEPPPAELGSAGIFDAWWRS
jgi:hypothetical protein